MSQVTNNVYCWYRCLSVIRRILPSSRTFSLHEIIALVKQCLSLLTSILSYLASPNHRSLNIVYFSRSIRSAPSKPFHFLIVLCCEILPVACNCFVTHFRSIFTIFPSSFHSRFRLNHHCWLPMNWNGFKFAYTSTHLSSSSYFSLAYSRGTFDVVISEKLLCKRSGFTASNYQVIYRMKSWKSTNSSIKNWKKKHFISTHIKRGESQFYHFRFVNFN